MYYLLPGEDLRFPIRGRQPFILGQNILLSNIVAENCIKTRMHSSRMRTARMLTVSRTKVCGGVYLVSAGGGVLSPRQGVPGLGGVPGPGGVYLIPGGCTWCRGVYLVPGGVPGTGGCTWSQCRVVQGEGHLVRYPPQVRYSPPPPCEQNDKLV